jgi:hypothetical protein
LLLARQAAAANPQAAEVWDQMNAERLTGMTHFAADLHCERLLRKGNVGPQGTRHPLGLHPGRALRATGHQSGWSIRMLREFMTQALSAALLDD